MKEKLQNSMASIRLPYTSNDFPVFRFADALLMKAEVLLRFLPQTKQILRKKVEIL